jgi:hypothetical protein
MSLRITRYGKRLGFILAGLLLGTTLGISSVASGEDATSRGFARPGFNRPAFNRPAFNRPAFNRPAVNFNRPAINRVEQLPVRPFVRPIINRVVEEVKVDNPCVIGAEEAGLFLNDEACVVLINNEED